MLKQARLNSLFYKNIGRALVTGLLFVGLAACGAEDEDASQCSELTAQQCSLQTNATVFLNLEQFEDLRAAGAHVLDMRGATNYTDGHVPGAVHASWRPFVDPERNGIMLDDVSELQDAARALGLNNDIPVLIYGDGGTGDSAAGRLFWTLEYLGHEHVYLLDGGIEAWKTLDLDVDTGEKAAPAPGNFTVTLQPQVRATIDEVQDAVDNGTLRLIDTRKEGEWEGDEADEFRRGNPRGGHIPTAVHYHWEDVIGADGKLRPREDIQADLTALGITPDTLTIPYCQTGVRSGFFYAVLKWLDYPTAKNYDGSWWEWSRDETREIE